MSETLAALVVFALVGSFSPGPNTMMVTASGAAFGFCRTIPHMVGITLGFVLMLIAAGLGLGKLFQAYPVAHHAMRIVGAAYLLYLAWRLAQASGVGDDKEAGKPLTVLEGALFQWVNPKALTLAIGVTAAFTRPGGDLAAEIALIVAVFGGMTPPSLIVWTLFGVSIRHFLAGSPRALRATNYALAALVALSVVLLFI